MKDDRIDATHDIELQRERDEEKAEEWAELVRVRDMPEFDLRSVEDQERTTTRKNAEERRSLTW